MQGPFPSICDSARWGWWVPSRGSVLGGDRCQRSPPRERPEPAACAPCGPALRWPSASSRPAQQRRTGRFPGRRMRESDWRSIWRGGGLPTCCAAPSAICSSGPIPRISGFRPAVRRPPMATAADEAGSRRPISPQGKPQDARRGLRRENHKPMPIAFPHPAPQKSAQPAMLEAVASMETARVSPGRRCADAASSGCSHHGRRWHAIPPRRSPRARGCDARQVFQSERGQLGTEPGPGGAMGRSPAAAAAGTHPQRALSQIDGNGPYMRERGFPLQNRRHRYRGNDLDLAPLEFLINGGGVILSPATAGNENGSRISLAMADAAGSGAGPEWLLQHFFTPYQALMLCPTVLNQALMDKMGTSAW